MKKFFKLFFSLNPTSITTGMILIVIILYVIGIPILDLIELRTFDRRFHWRGTKKPSPIVVAAVIDEKSLDQEGKWPWPRYKIAELINKLSDDGAKVIGFDVFFSEPDENSNLIFINQLNQKVESLQIENDKLKEFLNETKLKADNDLILANSIRESKAAIILGYFFHTEMESLGQKISDEELENRVKNISNSIYPLILYEGGKIVTDPFTYAEIIPYAPEVNLAILSEAATNSGYLNFAPSSDGVVREMPLAIKFGESIFTPLAIQCVWNYLDRPNLMLRFAEYGVQKIVLGDISIPTDEEGNLLINYLGPPNETFPSYSITDILHGNLPEGTFEDKIVIVGSTATGAHDLRNTPFSGTHPGLEVHTTIIDNILRNDFISKPEWARIYDIIAIVILGLLPGIFLPRLSAIKAVIFTAALFILHIFVSRFLFAHFGLWVNIVYPLLTLIVVYTSLTLYHYMTEERERKKIRGAFSYYVSSSVVNEMLKDTKKLKLGGDKKDLSVLFSDIRGFTTISEGLTPEELVNLLNEYLTVMTDIVFKYNGTLDKYIGDAIMAIYGAPLEQPDHPSKACRSAIDMIEGLKRLNEKWIQEGKTPLDIGIGINTGPMMVGNMGSDQRFDYTVMGDAVNLGSRLEGANKSYRTNILISESTYKRVKDEFICMELDSVRVKGRVLPVSIYQLVGVRDYVPIDYLEAINYFHEGLQFYRKQEWEKAIEAFETVSAMNKNIYPAELYIKRAMELKASPPPAGWDGVFTMKEK